jgi:hypothetical protein
MLATYRLLATQRVWRWSRWTLQENRSYVVSMKWVKKA